MKKLFKILGFWFDLNWKIRCILPIVLILVSTILLFCGTFWVYGWAWGIALFLFCGKTNAEKNGYRF